MDFQSAGMGLVAGLIVGALAMRLLAAKSVAAPAPVPEPIKPTVVKPDGSPVRVLALLQAESRLVDFLMEDISQADDAQVGQAVRDIHTKAQAALKRHVVMDAVLPGREGSTTTVPKGFDPSAVRVLGNVAGPPPYTGEIMHPGWRVKSVSLAAPPAGADEFVIQPAEVQIA